MANRKTELKEAYAKGKAAVAADKRAKESKARLNEKLKEDGYNRSHGTYPGAGPDEYTKQLFNGDAYGARQYEQAYDDAVGRLGSKASHTRGYWKQRDAKLNPRIKAGQNPLQASDEVDAELGNPRKVLEAKMAYNEQVKPQVTKPGKTVKGKSTK